ncbi:MAG: UbiD family decarboxylase [Desulfobacterales bacterium]|nr:UbiD family decarboxylase [Desulfobacterales bacterium]
MTERNLSPFLQRLRKAYPEQVVAIKKPVNPADFEVTALLRHLEVDGKFPLLFFENPLDLNGRPSRFQLATNLFATRQRCAFAMGLDPEKWKLELSLEFARRENAPLPPELVDPSNAPVREVVHTGKEADLRMFPIVRHHEMDGGPYVDMTPVMKDPDQGFYNVAFLRNQYMGPQRLGIHMSPRHNWTLFNKYEGKNLPTPVIIVVGHHPAFYLGALNVAAFGVDDYRLIGGIMRTPLRLTASETWGQDFLVPADAEIIIEGEIPPLVREVEAPFGEFPGTYGPQRLRPVIDVKAITHRQDAVYQDIFVGYRENWTLGGIPKEGSLFGAIQGVVPAVRQVHFPLSGSCRFNCYLSLDKKVEGEQKQAALMAMAQCDFVKNVIVVDADVDVFNEQEVMWAVATRVQPHADVDIIRNIKANTLDPSLLHDISGSKMIIDATMPTDRPFAARVNVPDEALKRIKLSEFISDDALQKIPVFLDSVRSR